MSVCLPVCLCVYAYDNDTSPSIMYTTTIYDLYVGWGRSHFGSSQRLNRSSGLPYPDAAPPLVELRAKGWPSLLLRRLLRRCYCGGLL